MEGTISEMHVMALMGLAMRRHHPLKKVFGTLS